MADDQNQAGNGASTEGAVADTSNSNTSTTTPADDPVKLKEIAENQKIRAEKAERELKELREKSTSNTPTQSIDADTIRKQTEETVTATLEKRDLAEMDYPDEIKTEIQRVAKLNSISVRAAAKDPYIKFKIEQVAATDRVAGAGVTQTPRSTPGAKQGEIPKFDMSTEQGRKDFKAWQDSKKK